MRTLLLLLFTLATASAWAQGSRFSGEAAVGTGISLNSPASTPFDLHIAGYYHISKRFSAGVGAGVSCYETVLIPVFGNATFRITRPRKFTPYVACDAGYAFAPARNANGGLYLNPHIGVEYVLRKPLRLFLALGYGMQRLERLKSSRNDYFSSRFGEQLRHNSLSIRAGIRF